MRTVLIATAAIAITCGSALAQSATTGERMNKAGMSNPMNSNAKMMHHHRKHHMKKKMMNDGMGNGMMKNDGMMNDKKM